jgi:hypothetical protein
LMAKEWPVPEKVREAGREFSFHLGGKEMRFLGTEYPATEPHIPLGTQVAFDPGDGSRMTGVVIEIHYGDDANDRDAVIFSEDGKEWNALPEELTVLPGDAGGLLGYSPNWGKARRRSYVEDAVKANGLADTIRRLRQVLYWNANMADEIPELTDGIAGDIAWAQHKFGGD